MVLSVVGEPTDNFESVSFHFVLSSTTCEARPVQLLMCPSCSLNCTLQNCLILLVLMRVGDRIHSCLTSIVVYGAIE